MRQRLCWRKIDGGGFASRIFAARNTFPIPCPLSVGLSWLNQGSKLCCLMQLHELRYAMAFRPITMPSCTIEARKPVDDVHMTRAGH
jgi:hypothetical protein